MRWWGALSMAALVLAGCTAPAIESSSSVGVSPTRPTGWIDEVPPHIVWNGTRAMDLSRHAEGNDTHWVILRDDLSVSPGLVVDESGNNPSNPVAILLRSFLEPAVGAASMFLAASYAPSAGLAEWLWDFGDGTTATGTEAAHTYAAPGNYTVRLVGTAADGSVTTTSMQVYVLPNAPTISIETRTLAPTALLTRFSIQGPIHQVSPGDEVTFSARPLGLVANGTTFHWDFGNGASAEGLEVVHAFAAEGDYTVRLTMTRPDGSTDTANRTVQVRWMPPTVHIWPLPAFPGKELYAQAWDHDGTIVGYDWDLGNGTHLSGQRITITRPGTYNVTVTVTDDDGLTASAGTQVIVHPQPPTVFALFASPAQDDPRTYTFDASASDPDGPIVAYAWDFGDGGVGEGPTPTHTYEAGGQYVVMLTVTDGDGLSASRSRTILVPE